MYVKKGLSPANIAKALNQRAVPWMMGRAWSRYVIRDMVTNPKYIGCNVSNRRSGKLQSARRWNPAEMWIRCEKAFEGLVDPVLYHRAETIAAVRSGSHTNEDLLKLLKAFLKRNGHISARSIRADPEMPCPRIYHDRFGSLIEAYRLIGYKCDRDMSHFDRDREIWRLRREFPIAIADELRLLRATASYDWQSKMVKVNNSLTIRAVVSRCRPLSDSHGWLLRLSSLGKPDLTIIGRLAPGNSDFLDYFLLKPQDVSGLNQVTLRPGKASAFDKFRYDNLSFLRKVIRLAMARRTSPIR
jgi:hypothetical protein